MPTLLFIPDRFADYRMWADLPDRVRDRAEVIHFDQHGQLPWSTGNGDFLDAVRRLAGDGPLDIVVSSGQAARFGFAVAEAGLAKGAAFFYPSPDRVIPGVSPDMGEVDLTEILKPYVPLVDAVREGDSDRIRETLMQLVGNTVDADMDSEDLARFVEMFTEHAGELRAFGEEAAADPLEPDPPWLEHPWIDRLETLAVPVTAVVPPQAAALGELIASRAGNAEIIVADPSPTMFGEPGQAAAVLLRMLDRRADA